MLLSTEKTSFFAPWAKIRRWSQAQGDSVHFEIYFTEELRFEWVEVETEQVAYLMSVIAEFVYLKQKESIEPEVDRTSWNKGQAKKLTWKMIKKELFSKEESKEESEDEDEPCQGFDNLEDEASTDDEGSSDGEEGAKAAPPSRRGSQYRFS